MLWARRTHASNSATKLARISNRQRRNGTWSRTRKSKKVFSRPCKARSVETAQTGLDLTKSGIESAKDVAQAAGSAVSEAVTSLATKAARVVRKPRKAAARSRGKPKRAVRAAPARKPASRKSTRKPAGKNALAKKPARKPVKKTGSAGRKKTGRTSSRRSQDHHNGFGASEVGVALYGDITADRGASFD